MFLRIIGGFVLLMSRGFRRVYRAVLARRFKACAQNVRFDPRDVFAYENIEVGNDVFIGPGAKFLADRSIIRIGKKVLFGPNVLIIAGNHNSSVVGQFMFDVKQKRPDDDMDVTIEDDVWVGAAATILKGVRLGRGCIVAAGAIVTKNVPPYAVAGGVPARLIGRRFSVEEALRHEAALYPESQRYSREALEITETH